MLPTHARAQICRPVYTNGNTKLEYTFPLGMHVLEEAVGTQKSLFMKFMLRLRTAGNSRVFKYISTKSAIRRENFVENCELPVHLDVNLGEHLKFDMLVGLFGAAQDTHSNATAVYVDVAASQQATVIQQMSLSTPLTFVLRLDETAVGTGAYGAYEVDVVTVFTMYFVSNVKKNSALRLLQAGVGYAQSADGSLVPDDDLLRICPVQRIEGVYGCIARFEVQHSMYEFEKTAVLPIAADTELCRLGAVTWAQRQRTSSHAFVDSMGTHANRVRERFRIDGSLRKSYVISHDIPWSEAEFRNDAALSYLQYPQHSISIFAVKIGGATAPALLPHARNIALLVLMRVSASLAFFAQAAASDREQVCRIVSFVTGVRVSDIEIQPGDEETGPEMHDFTLVLRTPYHNSQYQNWHVHRLIAHISRPTTQIRLRLQAMLEESMQAWPAYTPSSRLEIVRAMAHFPSGVVPSRRLLATPAVRRTGNTALNRTTSFFVRSNDAIENSDSMLLFWSIAGNFSRMLVFTLRYSLRSYCLEDEITNMHVIEHQLAPAIRSASNHTIARVRVVAFSPSAIVECPVHNVLAETSDIRLDVEVIVYYNTAGVFGISASSDLRLVGVEQVVVISTKNTSRDVDILLDTRDFRVDGAVLPPIQAHDAPRIVPRLAVAGIVGVSLGALALALCSGLVFYRLCFWSNAPTPSPPYAPLLVTDTSQCYVLPHLHAIPLCGCQDCHRDRPCFVLTVV